MATKSLDRNPADQIEEPQESDIVRPRPSSVEADDDETEAESIARRAYERFLMRGEEHGHDQEDWFEAEREVRGRRR